MQRLIIPNYTIEELEVLLHSNSDYVVGMRLMALIQVKNCMSSRELERFYFKSHSRYCVWVNNFNTMGVEGLRNKQKSGRKPLLSDKQREILSDVIKNNIPEDFGFNSATWNGHLVGEYIKRTFGVEYKKAQVYNILKALDLPIKKQEASILKLTPSSKPSS